MSRLTVLLVVLLFSLNLVTILPGISQAVDEPNYQGRTLSEWAKELKAHYSIDRRDAAIALGKMGPKAKAAVEVLASSYKEETSPMVRLAIVEALQAIDPEGKTASACFAEAVLDPLDDVREIAFKNLAKSGGTEAFAAFSKALKHERVRVRLAAAEALAQIRISKGVDLAPLAAAWEVEESPYVRVKILEVLIAIDPNANVTKEVVVRAFLDRGEPASDLVKTRFKNIDSPSLVKCLCQGLELRKENVRKAAAETLARLGPKAKEAIPSLKCFLKVANDEEKAFVQATLAQIDPVSFPLPLIDLGQPKLRTTFKGHTAPVLCVALSGDGKLLASGGGGSELVGGFLPGFIETDELKLWNVDTGKENATLLLERFGGGVTSLAFSKDGKLLASGRMAEVHLWDVVTGKEKATFKHSGPVSSVAFSADGKLLAAGSAPQDEKGKTLKGEIKLWSVATGKEKTTLKHTGPVSSVAFSGDGKLLAAGSGHLLLRFYGKDTGDCTVKLWDVATGNERTSLKGHTGAVSCVALSDNGKLLASGSAYADENGEILGELKLWDLTTNKERATFKLTGPVSSLALSADGKLLATGGIPPQSGGEVILWDVAAGKKIATLKHTDFVSSVTLSGDGKLLVSGSGDFVSLWGGGSGFAGTVKLWDILALKKPEK